MLRRITLAVAAAIIALSLAPAVAEAKPQLLRVWIDAHAALANGQGRFFNTKNGPYVGFGGACGVQVIVFEAFFDVNVFDLGHGPGEQHPTMFNMLGGGINAPIEVNDKLRLFVRGNIAYTFAPYDSVYESTGDNNGYIARGGGGADFMPNRFLAFGAAAYGGYHVFGSRAGGDNGSHFLAQIYTRFELGF